MHTYTQTRWETETHMHARTQRMPTHARDKRRQADNTNTERRATHTQTEHSSFAAGERDILPKDMVMYVRGPTDLSMLVQEREREEEQLHERAPSTLLAHGRAVWARNGAKPEARGMDHRTLR